MSPGWAYPAPGTRRVVVSVPDEVESEKFTELKRLIVEGDASEFIDGDAVFAEIRARFAQKYPA